MVIKNQKEILGWLAIIFAELVNLLHCFVKDRLLEFVGVMGIWQLGLPNSNIEDKAAEISDVVEQAICEMPEFLVPVDILDCIKAGPLLFPLGRMFPGPLDLI